MGEPQNCEIVRALHIQCNKGITALWNPLFPVACVRYKKFVTAQTHAHRDIRFLQPTDMYWTRTGQIKYTKTTSGWHNTCTWDRTERTLAQCKIWSVAQPSSVEHTKFYVNGAIRLIVHGVQKEQRSCRGERWSWNRHKFSTIYYLVTCNIIQNLTTLF